MKTISHRYLRFFPIYLFTLCFSNPGISDAQQLGYGIKGGLNISGISLENFGYETQSQTGFNLYLFGDYNFSRYFSLSLEEGYTQKGFKISPYDYNIEGEDYYGSIKARLNYFDITLSAKVKFTDSKIVPYISAGPSFGMKVSNHGFVNGKFTGYPTGDLRFFLDNINETSFGIKSGAGVEIKASEIYSIIFEINYNFDLTEDYDTPDIRLGINSWVYSENVKNNVLELQAGIKF